MIINEGGKQVSSPVYNRIIGTFQERNSRVSFKGTGNILCCEQDTRLDSCDITFCSDNAVIYLAANRRHWTKMKIDAWRETSIYVGRNNYFNGILTAIVSERKNLIMGDNGVYSFGIWLRTADPHLLYSIKTRNRINPSKSILVGDHVWLGQNALILKGTAIGSGSVLAAGAVIAGKQVPSHTVFGGNPAKLIQSDVFFSGDSVHDYTEEQTEVSMQMQENTYVYDQPANGVTIAGVDKRLLNRTPEERLAILKELAADNKDRNRFFIPQERERGLRVRFHK